MIGELAHGALWINSKLAARSINNAKHTTLLDAARALRNSPESRLSPAITVPLLQIEQPRPKLMPFPKQLVLYGKEQKQLAEQQALYHAGREYLQKICNGQENSIAGRSGTMRTSNFIFLR